MIPRSCDTAVALGKATRSGETIFGKNSDRPAVECQPLVQRVRRSHAPGATTRCQFVSLPEVETTYRHVGSRPCWCWGYEHGFNEHQVVIGNEGLASKFEESQTPRLIGMEVLRLGLERGRSAAEAVDAMTTAISQYGQGKFVNEAGVRTYDNGYIVADSREAYVIETAGHEWAVRRVEVSAGISNVYSVETNWDRVSPKAEHVAKEEGWWCGAGKFSFADAFTRKSRTEGSAVGRRRRSCTVLEKNAGSVDARTMMALLSDHSDGEDPGEPFQTKILPGSGLCIHAPADGSRGNTAASLVADLCNDGSRLPVYWCSMYSPCLGLFLPIFIEGELPEILNVGDENPNDDSPWWLFNRLSRLVMADADGRTAPVREKWSGLQESLFNSAYVLAERARGLLDVGRTEEASQELSAYMAESTGLMLSTVREMIGWFSEEAKRTPDDLVADRVGLDR